MPAEGADAAQISKAEAKRRAKKAAQEERKRQREKELAERKEAELAAKLEKSKEVKLVEDKTLPPATKVTIEGAKSFAGKRVRVEGWVHHLRVQGAIWFIELRDGTGFPGLLQCVLTGQLTRTYEALTLCREACVSITGKLVEDARAKGGLELQADYWALIGPSSSDIENVMNEESDVDVLYDNRHLWLRQLVPATIMRMRSVVLRCMREHFYDKKFVEVTPPTLVQTSVEGGSTLFKFDYYGEPAYLTQSSQLYLETVVPVFRKVFCCVSSYRAEKSRTRRHLSEFTHFEGEVALISFEDLLNILEDMIVDVAERVARAEPEMLRYLNPNFKVPKKPFRRMNYADAVKFCREHNIYKDEENKVHFEFGDDIPEAPERKMTDMINEPILLTRFPVHMKSFYMARCPEDQNLTESVDVLMPGVGEIVGGSMRLWDLEKLYEGYKREGIDPAPYYWYNDLRKYGSCPHGGWGLGIERFLVWMLNQDNVRKVCLYPRHLGRCKP